MQWLSKLLQVDSTTTKLKIHASDNKLIKCSLHCNWTTALNWPMHEGAWFDHKPVGKHLMGFSPVILKNLSQAYNKESATAHVFDGATSVAYDPWRIAPGLRQRISAIQLEIGNTLLLPYHCKKDTRTNTKMNSILLGN